MAPKAIYVEPRVVHSTQDTQDWLCLVVASTGETSASLAI